MEANFQKITKEIAEENESEIEEEIESEINENKWEYKEFNNPVLDKQNNLKSAYKQAKKDLNIYQDKFKEAETKYDTIRTKIKKQDINNDGILDSNDIIQEENESEEYNITGGGIGTGYASTDKGLNSFASAINKILIVDEKEMGEMGEMGEMEEMEKLAKNIDQNRRRY